MGAGGVTGGSCHTAASACNRRVVSHLGGEEGDKAERRKGDAKREGGEKNTDQYAMTAMWMMVWIRMRMSFSCFFRTHRGM